MGIERLPAWLRLLAYAAATTVLLYLCLAPSRDLPPVKLWDKAEHASAWVVLTGLGLALFPRRSLWVAGFALALGALVEVLQALAPTGRDADVRDWLADAIGVGLAFGIAALVRRIRR